MGAGTAAARPDAHREVARGDGEQGERTQRVPVSVEEQRRCFCRRRTHTAPHAKPESVSGSGISSAVPLQHLAVLHCRSTGHPQRGERRGAGSWRRAHSCWSSATSRSRLPAAWCRWICAQITLARVSQPVGMRLVAAIEWVLGGRAAGPWHGRGEGGGRLPRSHRRAELRGRGRRSDQRRLSLPEAELRLVRRRRQGLLHRGRGAVAGLVHRHRMPSPV